MDAGGACTTCWPPCQATLDLPVRLGREAQVRARLLAVRAPQEVVDQRRRRLREEAKAQGQMVSAALGLGGVERVCDHHPPDGLTVTEALVLARARWQIELLFKLWKSHGQIDLVRDVQPWRVLCELYGRLLNQIVQHWLLLVSGWDAPARSWGKAAQTIRTHWIALATAMGQPARLRDALTTLARCIQAGCRKNRRRKHPCTFQRFLMSTDSCVA
ncbi:hypothetical protein [Kouleothrix sp.]|uniref:hypothetical protein n=1 Tax=Kouleothrix sp. TaxID=2779161 RepID=UPI00391B8F44